jgi:uncharacterized protein
VGRPLTRASRTRADLRRDLTRAIRRRDAVAVSALRTALAAIENAEAVQPGDDALVPEAGGSPVAGAVVGLGAAEVARRELSDADLERIIRTEVRERVAAAVEYEHRGQHARAQRLRAEAALLGRYAADAPA